MILSRWGTSVDDAWIDALLYDPHAMRPTWRMLYVHWGKRALDVGLAAVGLGVTAPLLALLWLAVRVADGHPAIFRQSRIGRRGQPFVIYKFRTMPAGVGDMPKVAARDVPLTRLGALLRRFCLDELPQLINVLRGDMSLVGPRPVIASEVALLRGRLDNGALDLRPGITGLAQIRGFEGMRPEAKARYDGLYATTFGATMDCSIILKTLVHLRNPPPVH